VTSISRTKPSAIARSLTDAPRGRLSFKDPKNGKSRTICLSAQLAAILRSHRAAQAAKRLALGSAYHDEGLVFAQPDGRPTPPWNFAEAFGDLVRRARVTRITLHDLRDTHASLLAKAGVPIEVVSQRPGLRSAGKLKAAGRSANSSVRYLLHENR